MIGSTLNHFKITAKLGEGGMGAVYRAEDTRLGREVAIKVLPEAVTGDAERLARFEREARVLAALNHPQIASIYEVGEQGDVHFLVMELALGATLADRIEAGPLEADETLSIARQIVRAVEFAHERGIVHRDLKPANVQVSADGQVKVLDFGLARAFESEGEESTGDLTHSPTLTHRATQAGFLLGTAAYMSPEQARGLPADRRSDVWAFGVVLWEMLTGRRLFDGDTISDSLAAVLRAEPSWDELPAATPRSVRRLLRRCLERDPSRRLQHLGDARLELDDAVSEKDEVAPTAPQPAVRSFIRTALPWLLATSAVLVAFVAWVNRESEEPPARATHLSFIGGGFHMQSNAAISADGRLVAFSDHTPTFQGLMHVRSLDTGETVSFAGSEGGRMPFFSPDGKWVAFFGSRTSRLFKAPVGGGSPTRLAQVSGGVPTGSWGEDGRLVYSDGLLSEVQHEGLLIVGEDGGKAEVLTTPEPHEAHQQPHHLPGDRWLLFVVSGGDREDRIEALSLVDGSRHVLIEDATTPHYSSGQLVFYRPSSQEVLAASMTLDPPTIVGASQIVISDMPIGSGREGAFAISATGTLIHHPDTGSFFNRGLRRLFAVSSDGEMEPLNLPPNDWTQPRVSPDGRSLLVRQTANPDCVLWLHDFDRTTTTRMTFDFDAHEPLWHPSGERVTFSSDDGEKIGVVEIDIDGSRDRSTRLVDHRSAPESWSPDGRWLVFSLLGRGDQQDLWIRDSDTGEERELVASRFNESSARVSPDARWIAYVSDESGREEVYVRSFPGADNRVQISSAGGAGPVWAPDAGRLYFQVDFGISMVRFDPQSGRPLGASEEVFSSDEISWARDTPYDLLPDGRFVVVEGDKETDRLAEMAVIIDWMSLLESPRPSR